MAAGGRRGHPRQDRHRRRLGAEEGAAIYNIYMPPNDIPGDAAKAGPWTEHVRRLFPNEAEHIIAWMAHRIQRPGIKPNFGVLLIGAPGIGKDIAMNGFDI
jgi:hypothetical protein